MPKAASVKNLEKLRIDRDIFESVRQAIREPDLVDPVTFAESEAFCGKRLYPRQRTLLRLMYLDVERMTDYDREVIGGWAEEFAYGEDRVGVSPDVWRRIELLREQGAPHFREILFVGGRRCGKGMLGGIVGAYQAYKLASLDSPQAYYGIDPTKDMYGFVVATSLTQAKGQQFSDILNTISGCRWFSGKISSNTTLYLSVTTPADVRRIAEYSRRGIPLDREVASIRFAALSSISRSGRGAAAFGLWLDEFAHHLSGTGSSQTGEEIYQALTPSLGQTRARMPDGRLRDDAIIYEPSSPYCLVPETRVLTDDLRWVPVGSLAVGDGVMGFDEDAPGGRGVGRSWRKAMVTETSVIRAPTYTVKTTGPSVTCTADHMWLVRRRGRVPRGMDWRGHGQRGRQGSTRAYRWVRTVDLRPGDQIGDIGTWDADESRDGGWLAGIYDGEGWVPSNPKQGFWVGICQNEGEVLDRIRALLLERGFQFWERQKPGGGTIDLGITGGLIEQMRFLGTIRPHRLLPRLMNQLWGARIYGTKSRYVEVVGVEEGSTTEVVALGTSTNTLVAEGLFSHNTKTGIMYELYEQALASEGGEPLNPEMLVIQLPSWSTYEDWQRPEVAVYAFPNAPQLYDEQARRIERRDPDAFKVEYRAQWAETINAYLNPKVVDRMFEPLVYPDGRERALENYTVGSSQWVYRGHADPSASQHNFALAIGHTEPVPSIDPDSGEEHYLEHVFLDYLHVWSPADYPDHQIDYLALQDELVAIIMQFPSLKDFSFDQYGGFVTVPFLKQKLRALRHRARVHEATATDKEKQLRYERVKSALGMGWVHAPRDQHGPDQRSLLELELKFLQVNKAGRIVKQSVGPVVTDDLADAASHVCSELLADQIDRLVRNERLSGVKLAAGAPGGYSGMLRKAPAEGGSAKDRLDGFGRKRLEQKQYGVGW